MLLGNLPGHTLYRAQVCVEKRDRKRVVKFSGSYDLTALNFVPLLDPLCQSDELCNGLVPTQAPTTPRITKPTTKTVTTHTVKNKNTSFTNYSIPTTRTSTPGN